MVGHNPGTNRLDFERSRLLTCVFLRHCCVLETARATVLGVRYAAISQILQTSREDFFSVFSCISAKKIIAHAKKRCFLLLRGSVLTRSWCSAKHFGTARCNSFLINSVRKKLSRNRSAFAKVVAKRLLPRFCGPSPRWTMALFSAESRQWSIRRFRPHPPLPTVCFACRWFTRRRGLAERSRMFGTDIASFLSARLQIRSRVACKPVVRTTKRRCWCDVRPPRNSARHPTIRRPAAVLELCRIFKNLTSTLNYTTNGFYKLHSKMFENFESK